MTWSLHRLYIFSDDNNNVGMCGCKNGLSNYPLCESQRRNDDANKCDEDCSVYVSNNLLEN